MVSTAFLATLLSAASVLAFPLESRSDCNGGGSHGSDYFTPSAIYNYDVGSGAINCHAAGGLVSKSTNNNGHDITTLITFQYPAAAAGKKCQFAFYLDSSAILTGSKKVDLFSSLEPAPGCTASWPPGNRRNNHIGRLSLSLGATATWDQKVSAYLTQPTDCKPAGTYEGYELVGVYDNDYVSWNTYVAGARIVYG
jgi:hypothetical protein